MATTTNYGWTTPDDTALVKDGASAIRTLGTSVDTTTKNLNPETTLGDIAYRSSTSNVNTRLGIGSAGQLLTVSAGVPAWTTVSSGSMTSIASGSLSGASVTLSAIVGTYKELKLVLRGISTSVAGKTELRINGATGGSDYTYYYVQSSTTEDNSTGETRIKLTPSALDATTTQSGYTLYFPDYADTTSYKMVFINGYVRNTVASTGTQIFGAGGLRSASAITSLTIITDTGTFDAGTYILYGVN
jgi:hypothetical protein